MNYGLYVSAAGTLTSLHRQDVLANNLANISTIGFKPDDAATVSRLPQRLELNAVDGALDPQLLLEQLGGGPFAAPSRIRLRQGELAPSGNDLDLAIQGDGFFVVQSRQDGPSSLRFTRDGRFTLNAGGELVMSATGLRVLDVNDQAIRLSRTAPVRIDGDGNVLQYGAVVARLQISSAEKGTLTKEGNNLIRFDPSGAAKRQAADGRVKQGFVEQSAVDPIMALNAMINASKAVNANATMMQYHDNLIDQAVNTLGRVA